jgi:1,2-diacylglycerol 3-alpha-glucosyltransferase
MKILLATESYWPNVDGGSIFEHNLVLWLQKQGHQVFVIAPSQTHKYFVEEDHGTIVYRMPSALLFGRFLSSKLPFLRVSRLVKAIKPDVVHIHNPFFIGFAALWTARKMKIPVVATNHNMPENLTLQFGWLKPLEAFLTWIFWKYFIWFYNRCNFVTSPTETAINMLVEHKLKTRHQPISNGIDLDKFKPEDKRKCRLSKRYSINKNLPVIIYTGRLDGEKRMDVWVNAIPYILKEMNAHFIIGGSGLIKKDLEKMVINMKLSKYVTFSGFVEEKDFPHIYHLADIFAISSPAELQSIVTLEAMASGLPIVVARAAALPELVEEGKNGYTFEVNNPKDMADKILKIINNNPVKMGKASREFVKRHDYRKSFAKYEDIYKMLASG